MFSSAPERQQVPTFFFSQLSFLRFFSKMATRRSRSSILLAAAILVTAVWRRRKAMLAARFAELLMMCERGDEEAVVR